MLQRQGFVITHLCGFMATICFSFAYLKLRFIPEYHVTGKGNVCVGRLDSSSEGDQH